MCCFKIGMVERISSHAHKTGFWYLLEVVFKISDERPRPFYMGAPFGIAARPRAK